MVRSKSMVVASFVTVASAFIVGGGLSVGFIFLAAFIEKTTGIEDYIVWFFLVGTAIFIFMWRMIYVGLINRGYK